MRSVLKTCVVAALALPMFLVLPGITNQADAQVRYRVERRLDRRDDRRDYRQDYRYDYRSNYRSPYQSYYRYSTPRIGVYPYGYGSGIYFRSGPYGYRGGVRW